MTDSRAAADPETLTFETTVQRGGRAVALAETYFYPEGGGQPADRGTIDGRTVADVQQEGEGVVHVLEDGDLTAGETVTGRVDPEFRRYCMRAHTASHALYGAGRRLLDNLGYGGFDISEERVRVDLTTTSDVDDATLVELERLVNRVVWESREVTWEERPKADALSDEAVAFNTKTEEGLAGETVRVVTIDGSDGAERNSTDSTVEPWDQAACGGTHVGNTREIGPVTLLSRSNPGEGLTRVEFTVGPGAIDRRATEKRAVFDAAAALGTNVEGIAEGIERLDTERATLAAERDDLRAELTERRLAELPTVERDGTEWLVGDLDRDANALASAARERVGDGVSVVALVAPAGSLAVATDGSVDAGDVVAEVTTAFGGGGGGSDRVAQAGGLDAGADEVVEFLRGE